MNGEDRTPKRPPRFAPTEHLATEAIAAYVDGELRMNAYLRASHHLSVCPECAAEVESQQQARIALRQSSHITAPLRLHDTLSRIPISELPGAEPTPPQHPAPGPAADHGMFAAGASSFGMRQDSFDSRRWTAWWRK
ncbi:hypothetical protein IU501_02055 [Nocardia otitidiscaviarum]|uniref:Predicted transmembrane transcriptional regulator (Anti-sigma factor) n=1 Tax=Nocardia otitidiscaviarum TaxID=1823 RepID=A0A378Y9T3_9NOCA|nr:MULTISPECIES: hypothetical protein [Nocardia]MBF6131789.1 hypothetical protein [Nocardia otitidiscaviarum]MBF6178145.1 hypothetical protein [Nocardia otitidiscaviarum]MBF6238447.1 hypothetical protein [Nocardia otitidiscaviarum]MBF6482920.1 hypothetical protein [Nocardia otitidiscaviarum]MCP9623219.1 hypothetical protein [Nocardia otitidiscaviarum]